MSGSEAEGNDPLDLTSLDADSLFAALGAVDRAIPDLLLSVKPVLAHLTSPAPDLTAASANKAIETYMATLDEKIQFVLRQTVYYLRETRASTSAPRPPAVGAIPTPFAASLPLPQAQASGAGGVVGAEGVGVATGEGVELGLYGMRTEVRVMKDLEHTLKRLREEMAKTSQGELGEQKDGGDQDMAEPGKEGDR